MVCVCIYICWLANLSPEQYILGWEFVPYQTFTFSDVQRVCLFPSLTSINQYQSFVILSTDNARASSSQPNAEHSHTNPHHNLAHMTVNKKARDASVLQRLSPPLPLAHPPWRHRYWKYAIGRAASRHLKAAHHWPLGFMTYSFLIS